MKLLVTDRLRRLAEEATQDQYEPKEVTVFFSAMETPRQGIALESANFQWIKYEFLFRKNDRHYLYSTDLYPWGQKAPGGQSVIDHEKNLTPSDLTVEDVEKEFKKILGHPELYPSRKDYPKNPEDIRGYYINQYVESEDGKKSPYKEKPGDKKYAYREFNSKFRDSNDYRIATKTNKLENP